MSPADAGEVPTAADAARIISVNRSLPRLLELPGRDVETGIDKRPATTPVAVSSDGLDGDGVGNRRHHGGPDQAVYLYGADEYAWWSEHHGLEVFPGLFGENVTVDHLASGSLEVGDRLLIDDLVLEVTAPRIPCATLSGRVGRGRFKDAFAMVGRPGAYTRVIEPGDLIAGQAVRSEPGGTGVTLLDCVDAYYDVDTPAAELERVLAAPVAERVRTLLEGRLAKGRS